MIIETIIATYIIIGLINSLAVLFVIDNYDLIVDKFSNYGVPLDDKSEEDYNSIMKVQNQHCLVKYVCFPLFITIFWLPILILLKVI